MLCQLYMLTVIQKFPPPSGKSWLVVGIPEVFKIVTYLEMAYLNQTLVLANQA